MNEDVLMKHITFYANLKTHFIFFSIFNWVSTHCNMVSDTIINLLL